MKTKRSLRLVALVGAAVLAIQTPASAQVADHSDVQTVLNQYQSHAGPGAAVYAGDAGGSWHLNKGTASITANRPISPDDQFRAASQTKSFTAAVVLQLVDEGLVELDAPIERYLPGVVAGNGFDGNVITVRQLLQHTAGVPRDASDPQAKSDGTYALAELVRSGLTQPPVSAPGAGWAYSNVGYYLLGMLIESRTGQDVGTAITGRIITPLGLSRTTFSRPGDRALSSPHLPGYSGGRMGPFFFWYDTTNKWEMSRFSTAGAVNSTLRDLSTFFRAVGDGKVVSAGSLAEMRETVPVPQAPEMAFGLGLIRLSLSCGVEAWGHAGDLDTGVSNVTMTTDDGRYAAVVTNTFVTNATEPTRNDVVDAALCDMSGSAS